MMKTITAWLPQLQFRIMSWTLCSDSIDWLFVICCFIRRYHFDSHMLKGIRIFWFYYIYWVRVVIIKKDISPSIHFSLFKVIQTNLTLAETFVERPFAFPKRMSVIFDDVVRICSAFHRFLLLVFIAKNVVSFLLQRTSLRFGCRVSIWFFRRYTIPCICFWQSTVVEHRTDCCKDSGKSRKGQLSID